MKWANDTRLLKLMDDLNWQGVNNRFDLTSYEDEKELFQFKKWLKQNSIFIRPDLVREITESYYFNGQTGDNNKGFYTELHKGQAAIASIYASQQSKRNVFTELHEQAMDWCEEADSLLKQGQEVEARAKFVCAMLIEQTLALLNTDTLSRSVLYRSAASCALSANMPKEAYNLAAKAFEGTNPPAEIAEELREIMRETEKYLEKVNA